MSTSRTCFTSFGDSVISATAAPTTPRWAAVGAILLAAGFALGTGSRAHAALQSLGDLPEGLGSHANGVSADGSVVVGFSYYIAPGGLLQSKALRWTQADGLHALFEGGLDYTSSALCVSADGLTIGGWHAPSIIEEKAFIWSAAAGEQVLATRSGVTALSGTGVPGAGYVAHGHEAPRAAIWDLNVNQHFIDGPNVIIPGSAAHGISADGTVVVGQAVFTTSNSIRAFRWTADTGMQNIGSPDFSGPSSEAEAVTPDGSVIVGATPASGGSSPPQAARWTAAGGWQSLGSLPGGTGGTAFAVSANGNTVVGASGGHAFIWRPARGIEDLQILLGPPSGWILTEARGVSADGKIIVGTANVIGVGTRAWIATLPTYGDLNCDGTVDFADIDPFVLALTGQSAYQAAYPDCEWLSADCNADGSVDFADIDPFVALLGS